MSIEIHGKFLLGRLFLSWAVNIKIAMVYNGSLPCVKLLSLFADLCSQISSLLPEEADRFQVIGLKLFDILTITAPIAISSIWLSSR